jgi:hypothetical protein
MLKYVPHGIDIVLRDQVLASLVESPDEKGKKLVEKNFTGCEMRLAHSG